MKGKQCKKLSIKLTGLLKNFQILFQILIRSKSGILFRFAHHLCDSFFKWKMRIGFVRKCRNFIEFSDRCRWEERSLNHHLLDKRGQAMYSVIHGGTDLKMREKSMNILTNMSFDGHAIGQNFQRNFDDFLQKFLFRKFVFYVLFFANIEWWNFDEISGKIRWKK